MKRFKLCLLHIGAAKTATTSMQASFALNRRKLADAGVYYPVTPGVENHKNLAVYAVDESRMTGSKRRALHCHGGDLSAFRQKLRKQMDSELRRVRQDTLLLSNEHLHQHLINVDEKETLKGFLDRWCEDYRIIVYLRRQDKLAISLYSTRLKAGATRGVEVLPNIGKSLPYTYDYRAVLEQYGEVFGQHRISPAIFEAEKFFDGDIIKDMYRRIGVSTTEGFKATEPANEALNSQAQAFLAEFNTHVSRLVDGRPNPLHNRVCELLGRHFSGRGKTVTRSEAVTFFEHFAESNEWVRRNFFPQQTTLFNEQFDEYPEALNNDISATEMIEVAAHLLQEQQEALDRAPWSIFNNLWLDQSTAAPRYRALTHLARRSPSTTLSVLLESLKPPTKMSQARPGK